MREKNNNRGAASRLIVIMLVLIAVMLVIIAVPAVAALQYKMECIGCEQAMKTAGDGLIIEYLNRFEESNIEEARETLEEVMPAREGVCPAGGTVYLIKDSRGIYEPVCGLHDPDAALRTRLNASYARSLAGTARRQAMAKTGKEPESVEITVNGKPLTCVRVTEEEMIHRGTDTTNGYEGIVAYYGVAGDFTFSAKTAAQGMGTAKTGDVCYFLYADKDHCAIWRSNDGWDGDAYQYR